jgi:nucleoside-diphosphate-sugar epimerase
MILITGASGMLGARVLDLFSGEEIITIGRHEIKVLPENVTFIKADITNKSDLEKINIKYKNITSIIHLAANVPVSSDKDSAIGMVTGNVLGTVNLLETFKDGLEKFIYASTAEVYGLPGSGSKISEQYLPKPQSYYGASKLSAEYFIESFASKFIVEYKILRFTVLYGPGDMINRAIPNFIKKAINSEDLEIYCGEELRDYLSIADAAKAIKCAYSSSNSGVYNIGTGVGVSIKDAARQILEIVGGSSQLLLKPRVKASADIVLDITKAKKELSFKPDHLFPELISEQVQWHREHQK